MNKLVEFFVRRYVFAISIFVALGLFGLALGSRLGVNILPNFELNFVGVTTVYPGAGAEEVAKQVSEPIEDALSTLPGINSLSSSSFEGISVVFIEFAANVNGDQAAVDVSQRVNAILGNLPDDITAPSVQKADPNADPILNVAVTAPGEDLRTVQRYAEDVLAPQLRAAEGVADVSVVGPIRREIQVLLDSAKLESYRLTPAQVSGAIGASSINLPLGNLTIAGERITFTGRNDPENLQDVENIVIDPVRGLRVSDIATVRDTSAEVDAFSRLNGEPVVLLSIQKQSGSNTVGVAEGIRRIVEENTENLPKGYSTTVVGDTSASIARTVEDTIKEVGIATVVVSIIVLLFLGRLGSVFSVVLAIPVSIAGALIVFGLAGFTLNIVTLVAIIVAIGLVVDDSIVVAEAIDRYREHGYGRIEAVLKGASEVSVPVLATTLALLAVFLPISILPGILGQFFREFGITLAATIVASYLEALFFLTVRLALSPDPFPPDWREAGGAVTRFGHDIRFTFTKMWRRWWYWLTWLGAVAALSFTLLGANSPLPDVPMTQRYLYLAGGAVALLLVVALFILVVGYILRAILYVLGAISRSAFNVVNVLTNALTRVYARTLRFALTNSLLTLIVAFLLFLSIIPIAPRLGFTFSPDSDSGLVGITMRLPTGTALSTTNDLAGEIENLLVGREEIVALETTVGVNAGDAGNVSASERAEFTLELTPGGERDKTNAELAREYESEIKQLLANYPEADIRARALAGGGPPPVSDYSITIASSDLNLLRERDRLARLTLEDSEYLTNVTSPFDTSVSERVFKLDSTRLSGTGLSVLDVYSTLRAYNVGLEAANLSDNGEDVPIQVRINPSLRDEQSLLSLTVFSQALDRSIPLSELGGFVIQEAPTTITRTDQIYTSTIAASVLPGAPATSQLRTILRQDLTDAGVFDSRVSEGQGVGLDLTGDLIFLTPIAFGLALILNYLVIASQFNSFKFPIYLLLTVPLALVGALWIFFLSGTPLDLFAVLGIIILPGLVVKNSILLLDLVINKETFQNMSLKDMLVEAAKTRLRPILMTTLTLIAISAPLLLGVGEGAELRYSLGLVIFGGVTVSALLTLFVIPAAFYRFERKKFDKELEQERQQTTLPIKPMPTPSTASD
jgi:hydrophobic/amphiphilic exporter-1 (mainly G- bacteria), HAE1 family